MSNEQDILIWKLDKELSRARLALGKIYTIVGRVYCWDVGHAMSKLERYDVDKIVKTLQEYFREEKTVNKGLRNMATWLVAFRERKFLTRSEGGCIETSLVSETIESEMDSCFEPTERGIKRFKKYHERVDGPHSVEIKVLSWSEMKEEVEQ